MISKTWMAILMIASYGVHGQSSIDTYILQKMEAFGFTGVGICYVKDGKVAMANGYGHADIAGDIPFTANSILEVASVSKPVTVTAAMILWEEGAFELDDPINDYLPFPINNPFYPDDTITIRMLMSHSSSLNFGLTLIDGSLTQIIYPPGQAESFESYVYDHLVPGGEYYVDTVAFRQFRPGAGYSYSNFAITILAWIVEQLAGMPFHEFCNERIFDPLCMESTAWYYHELDTNLVAHGYLRGEQPVEFPLHEWAEYPGVGLKSTVIDISRFMAMHLNYGELEGVKIIDSTTEALMRIPQFIVQDAFIPHDNQAILIRQEQCLGIDLITESLNNNLQIFGKSGQDLGICTRTYFIPAWNAVITAFANSNIGDGINLPLIDILLELHFIPQDSISTTDKVFLNCEAYHPCQHTESYLSAHPDEWPVNAVPMKLGTKEIYTKDEALNLLSMTEKDDASLVLGKALVCTKVNISRSTELGPILSTIYSAMNMIGEERLPFAQPVPYLSQQGQDMLALAAILDDYNSGSLNAYSCSGIVSKVDEGPKQRDHYGFIIYPNPMTTTASVSIWLPEDGQVRLNLIDIDGQRAIPLIEERSLDGELTYIFDASNLEPGMYFLQLQTGTFTRTQKVMIAGN